MPMLRSLHASKSCRLRQAKNAQDDRNTAPEIQSCDHEHHTSSITPCPYTPLTLDFKTCHLPNNRNNSPRRPHLAPLLLNLLLIVQHQLSKLLNLILSLWCSNQHNAPGHNHIIYLKAPKRNHLLDRRTRPEDTSDNLRINHGTEGQVDLAEMRILFGAVKDFCKGRVGNVAAGRYV